MFSLRSLLAFAPLALATCPSLPAHTIFQFNQTQTWLENIAVRPNGDLLLTLLSPTASLYTLKNPASTHPEFSLLHTFPNATGLLGITETRPDVFSLLSTQLSDTLSTVPGSSAVWEVSFANNNNNSNDVFNAPRKIVSLPDVIVPNGIASIPNSATILIGDSLGGTVTRCATADTASCEVVLGQHNETTLAPVSSIGVNGLKYREGYLYWSNSDLVSLFRIPATAAGYPVAHAEVEKLGRVNASFVDDFAEDAAGTFWVATGPDNTIATVRRDGVSEVVVGSKGEFTVAGSTAAAFGRTARDANMLYVVTNGAVKGPVDGRTEPAKVVVVNTERYIVSTSI